MFKPPAHEVVVGISAGQRPGEGAWFRIDRELNALQNGRVADVQGQLTDKGRDTCRETGDCYRGVICLIGSSEMGEDHEDGPDDD